MMDINTADLLNTLVVKARANATAMAVLKISPTAGNASKAKSAQRQERSALDAVNKHLKECVKMVKVRRLGVEKLAKTHSYRPTRRGLKKIKTI